MKSFWSYISNGNNSVGCTGQTVYVYDKEGNECAKFKDIIYAYTSSISPNGRILAVKSTAGWLAVYSLETMNLIKKFRFSEVDSSQDDGFCFTDDSKHFINIERHIDELHNSVVWYDAQTFEKVNSFQMNGTDHLDDIEQGTDGQLYVLGYFREKRQNRYFVGIITKDGITDWQTITLSEYDFYWHCLNLKRCGFTDKACEWTHGEYDFEKIKNGNYSLKRLFDYYKEKESG